MSCVHSKTCDSFMKDPPAPLKGQGCQFWKQLLFMATSGSIENQDQLVKQVESGVAPACLELKNEHQPVRIKPDSPAQYERESKKHIDNNV